MERTVLGHLNLNSSCGAGQMRPGGQGNAVGQGGLLGLGQGGLLAAGNVVSQGGLLVQVQDGARSLSAMGLSGLSLARRNKEFQEPCIAVVRSAGFTKVFLAYNWDRFYSNYLGPR